MYTLKVNQRAQEEKERKEKEKQARELEERILALSGPAPKPRRPKGLKFHEPGVFKVQAEKQRKEAKLKALRENLAKLAEKSGINDAVKLATLTISKEQSVKNTSNLNEIQDEVVPHVEWWDKRIIGNEPLDKVIVRLDATDCRPEDIFNCISNLIQRPPIKQSPGANTEVQIPLYLTKDEYKKLRKQRRRDEQAKLREDIKNGLRPKPEPKLKRSNLIYTLADEGIVDPSKAELKVKEQEEKRRLAHVEHNEAKKLTIQEKRNKRLNKIKEDLNVTGIHCTIFKVNDMTSQANKFKVVQNARQLTMTGVLVLQKDMNIVIVEGGPKQQRKFKHLMLDRINWVIETVKSKSPEDKDHDPINTCKLVWEGQVERRSFIGFKTKVFNEQSDARVYFKSLNLEHYWDLAFNTSILESIQDDGLTI